jgi:hypothetical protein
VASKPLSNGIAMSMTTTAGRSFLTRATAWRPSFASPTTSRSSSSSSSLRKPSRTTVWSSASRTVIRFIDIQWILHLSARSNICKPWRARPNWISSRSSASGQPHPEFLPLKLIAEQASTTAQELQELYGHRYDAYYHWGLNE